MKKINTLSISLILMKITAITSFFLMSQFSHADTCKSLSFSVGDDKNIFLDIYMQEFYDLSFSKDDIEKYESLKKDIEVALINGDCLSLVFNSGVRDEQVIVSLDSLENFPYQRNKGIPQILVKYSCSGAKTGISKRCQVYESDKGDRRVYLSNDHQSYLLTRPDEELIESIWPSFHDSLFPNYIKSSFGQKIIFDPNNELDFISRNALRFSLTGILRVVANLFAYTWRIKSPSENIVKEIFTAYPDVKLAGEALYRTGLSNLHRAASPISYKNGFGISLLGLGYRPSISSKLHWRKTDKPSFTAKKILALANYLDRNDLKFSSGIEDFGPIKRANGSDLSGSGNDYENLLKVLFLNNMMYDSKNNIWSESY